MNVYRWLGPERGARGMQEQGSDGEDQAGLSQGSADGFERIANSQDAAGVRGWCWSWCSVTDRSDTGWFRDKEDYKERGTMLERLIVDWKSRQSFSPGETKGLNDALNFISGHGKGRCAANVRACRPEKRPADSSGQNVP